MFEYGLAIYGFLVTSPKIMKMLCDDLTQEKLGITILSHAQYPAMSSPAMGSRSHHIHGGHT